MPVFKCHLLYISYSIEMIFQKIQQIFIGQKELFFRNLPEMIKKPGAFA